MNRRCAIKMCLAVTAWGLSAPASATEHEALSFGSGGCGKLQGGEFLPCSGPNFESFAKSACALGRNALHPLVRDTVVDAYRSLAHSHPDRRWQYGEMGNAKGGKLWPHKTHQNGLSADFFVPVIAKDGAPALVPISVFHKLGYGLSFRKDGTLDDLRIDFRAIGAHLLAIESAGRAHDVVIERIILTPDFHQMLFAQAPETRRLAPRFMKREAWVRHDEHYHVDFGIPQRLLRPLSCAR
ncbi:MAG TPA: penicillin-insensitive murein endopeptidase [Pseudomonadota bacterium]|jgi:penicillin-insensitive murein endopeptidase|nr:penicillin-insensitive murein endopeptidase [Pseudomonadota bacterium]HNN51807.1 penicillin-insensitive murein endopeptidase [Pseudomonadota bacterium]